VIEDLDDDEVVTQYGNSRYPPGEPFRQRPRPGKESDISLIAGRKTVDEAACLINPRRDRATAGEGVRYANVGRLRHEAGLQVERTPYPLNPDHASATLDGDQEWTDDVSAKFNACFGEPHWKEEL